MKHKWHKEIKAWADGAEIEYFDELKIRWLDVLGMPRWDSSSEYRIKPQPKEPQYLYVYKEPKSDSFGAKQQVFITTKTGLYFGGEPIGKIKLEVDDD
jgi:hypothetical protein